MSLDRVLNACSVAVVGASKTETKRGCQAIKTLLEERYEGAIYPVNPNESSIFGLRCYRKVSEIEGSVDLALITTPAQSIPAILEDCGKKGVSGVVVIAGGFGETGENGKELEAIMVEVARKNQIRIIGPNTSGMINLSNHLNLVGLRQVPPGNIALLTQSGNMALSLITEAAIKSQKGFSYYVGVGNEADIRFHEYLEFFLNDPKTLAILMYVEGMRDGRSFLQQAYRTTRHKPIIILKSGRSATGKRSAGSHTGALAGISEVARTAFKRAGIITIENSDELFPVAEALSSLPPIRNNQVAILADGGGHATIAADLLSEAGLKMPPLSEKTQEKLQKLLPPAASLRNPVDVAGGTDTNPALFADCARILLHDNQIGGLLLVGLFGGYGIRFAKSLTFAEEDAAHQMGKLVQEVKKPIVVHSLYDYLKPHSLDLLRYYNIPVYDSLEIASKCICACAEYGSYLQSYEAKTEFVFKWSQKAKIRGKAIIENAVAQKRNLLEHEAKELLGLHGATVGDYRLARTPDEAAGIAVDIGRPLAMKIVSPQVLHKSDVGGVVLDVEGPEQARKIFSKMQKKIKQQIPNADLEGILISPMAKEGLETIVGTKIDDQFGPILMFGIGGIMVEVLKDVVYRVLPITARTAKKMVKELRSSPLLEGYRGRPPGDKKAIQKLLLIVSEVIESYPEIQEMDLNPVVVFEEGLEILDARIILKSENQTNHHHEPYET